MSGHWRSKVCFKVGSHDPILVQLSFKSVLCMMENVGVHTIQFSHPVISGCTPIQINATILVLRIYAHFTAARSSSSGHFVKIFFRIERGEIKNWRLF